jgi:2-polyprenyl-3-methyl-5-hydroxy-6-metoxy-1,4-benzoquinol methylase
MYLAKVLKYLRAKPNVSCVLDAGCGGGDFAEGLSAEFHVYGIDLNETAIAAAQKRRCGTFIIGSLYEDLAAPFNVDQFDAIVAIDVIEHLYSPRLFVQHAKKAIKPEGLFILTTPYWGYLKNIVLAVTNRTDRKLTALWEGGHIKHWSKATLKCLLTSEDFQFVAFEGCGEGLRAWTPYLWNSMLMVFRRS